jgi:hypothetical protein
MFFDLLSALGWRSRLDPQSVTFRDQHNRKTIANWVTPTTARTDEEVTVEHNFRFASGADKDIQKLLTEHQYLLSPRARRVAQRYHPGLVPGKS